DQVARTAEENSSRVIFVVFLSLLLDLLGFTLILPLLPSILDHFSKNDVSLIGSLFSLLQFLASPLTGAASDSFGRRPALLATAAMIGLAFSLGFTLGPMLGAFLVLETEKDQVFYARAAIFATIFAVADFLFISACLPETLPKEKRVIPSGNNQKNKLMDLQILGLVYFLYLFLFSGLEYTLGFLVHQHFQFSSLEQGKMFFCIGVTMAVIQGGYTRQIKPGAELRVVKTAIMLSAPGFLLIGWSPNIIILGTGLLFYSFVYWLAGAEVCFTVCASLFLLPFVLLRWMPKPNKEE
ncbi:hypothetical protein Chor_015470, partial [Crotalus horridus]